MFSFVLLQQRCQLVSTHQSLIVTSTDQMQHLHHFNINKANTTPVSDCNVIKPNATSVSDLTTVRHNNNTSTTTRQCNVKTLLERPSSRTTSTRQCKGLYAIGTSSCQYIASTSCNDNNSK